MGKLRGIVDLLDMNLDSVDDLQRMDNAAKLDFDELMFFGDKASLALAMGLIDADDAQYLYEIHHDFNSRMLAERIVYMQFMSELVPMMIGAK